MDNRINLPQDKCSCNCNCIPQETTIKNVKLARAYVPYQKLCKLLYPIEALKYGTAFPELYSPYDVKKEKEKCSCAYRGGGYYEE